MGDDIGNGGFSRAAGTVENHIGNIPGFNQAAQYGPLSQNMLLAHHLIQGLRPQQVCQRLIHHMPPFQCKKGPAEYQQARRSFQNVATSGSAGWAFFSTDSAVSMGPTSPLYRGWFSAVILAVTITQDRDSSPEAPSYRQGMPQN